MMMMMFRPMYALYYYIRPDPCPRSQACSPQETEVTRSLGRLSLGFGSLNKIPVMMMCHHALALSLSTLFSYASPTTEKWRETILCERRVMGVDLLR